MEWKMENYSSFIGWFQVARVEPSQRFFFVYLTFFPELQVKIDTTASDN